MYFHKHNYIFLCVFLTFSFLAEAEEFVQLSTIDDSDYQMNIKLIDFPDNNAENGFLLDSHYCYTSTNSDLLAGYLGEDGHPSNREGVSMAALFTKAQEINRLFPTEPLKKEGTEVFGMKGERWQSNYWGHIMMEPIILQFKR